VISRTAAGISVGRGMVLDARQRGHSSVTSVLVLKDFIFGYSPHHQQDQASDDDEPDHVGDDIREHVTTLCV
jgi:hypothetical protein